MTEYDDYFMNDDKPFAENINDSLLLSNVFDYTVHINIPDMFKDKTWNGSIGVKKCGVSLVSLEEEFTGDVNIETDIDGHSVLTATNGGLLLGFYPNFNSYGRIKSISWEATNPEGVNIILKDKTGATITNIINGAEIPQTPALKELQKFLLEINLNNTELKNINIVVENKSTTNRHGANVNINKVEGLENTLQRYDTIISALENDIQLIHSQTYVDSATAENIKNYEVYDVTDKSTSVTYDENKYYVINTSYRTSQSNNEAYGLKLFKGIQIGRYFKISAEFKYVSGVNWQGGLGFVNEDGSFNVVRIIKIEDRLAYQSTNGYSIIYVDIPNAYYSDWLKLSYEYSDGRVTVELSCDAHPEMYAKFEYESDILVQQIRYPAILGGYQHYSTTYVRNIKYEWHF